mmetsp:Transcript_11533/g.17228  ORF Transcript_11533/g.17228 Transcript_11533/m.17228 type:complete len:299 (+) Transcript_11533:344-1240(+)
MLQGFTLKLKRTLGKRLLKPFIRKEDSFSFNCGIWVVSYTLVSILKQKTLFRLQLLQLRGKQIISKERKCLTRSQEHSLLNKLRLQCKITKRQLNVPKKAGFDGVEIHSANGYLIDQFLQSSTNVRTDKYGGSMENRVRFLTEVTEAVLKVFPASRVGFRLSPNGAFGDMGSADNDKMFPFIAKTMDKYKLAYMHLMDGLGFGFHNKCSIVRAAHMRKHYSGPIMANIGLTRDMAEGMIRSGTADLCAFGRLYISNPDLPERFANDWKLTPAAEYPTWWKPTGAKGYTDWPFYKEEKK